MAGGDLLLFKATADGLTLLVSLLGDTEALPTIVGLSKKLITFYLLLGEPACCLAKASMSQSPEAIRSFTRFCSISALESMNS